MSHPSSHAAYRGHHGAAPSLNPLSLQAVRSGLQVRYKERGSYAIPT